MRRIHVVAAVIHGDCCGRPGEIFIAKRPDNVHKGGLWEFPGGKVDEGETPRQALLRELQEELGIQTTACQRLVETHHDYPDKQIHLEFWDVTDFDGEPHGAEGQPVKWVKPGELGDYPFPEANQALVNHLIENL
ncbi:8-oxo-dGTP diphosphatase MutT [Porticoccus sp. GXU_MW_L64]